MINKVSNANTGTVTIEIAQSPDMIRQAKQLCHKVYLQAGYIDRPFPGEIIPHEYDDTSIYIVALNAKRSVTGTIRLTLGSSFKTFQTWAGHVYPACTGLINDVVQSNSFEIGALAVDKNFSSVKVSWQLYKKVFECALLMDLAYAVISIDARALRTLEMLGWQAIKIGDPMNYFGSLTVPCIMPVRSQLVAVGLKNQAYYNVLAA